MQQGSSSQASSRNLARFVESINGEARIPHMIQYRVTATYPSLAIFIVDGVAFISTYLRRLPHLKNPTFKFSRPGRLFDICVNHYLEIWEDDRLTRVVAPSLESQ